MNAPPIFVLGLMRSGTTLMLRALNCHPMVGIWGEHGGALQPMLRDLQPITLDQHSRERIAAGYERRDVIIGEISDTAGFDAWVSPFSPDELESSVDTFLRRYIEEMFTRGLGDGVRWGFKETRYPRTAAERLAQLFPDAHFVIMTRQFEPWASSVIRAPWRSDLAPNQVNDPSATEQALTELTQLWVRRTRAMLDFAADDPGHRLIVSLQRFADVAAASRLYDRLGVSGVDESVVREVLGARTGSSDLSSAWDSSTRARLGELIANFASADQRIATITDRVSGESLP